MDNTRIALRSVYNRTLDRFDASQFLDVGSRALERGIVDGRSRTSELAAHDGLTHIRRGAITGAYYVTAFVRQPRRSTPRLGTTLAGVFCGSREHVGAQTGIRYAPKFSGIVEYGMHAVTSAAAWNGGCIGAAIGAAVGFVKGRAQTHAEAGFTIGYNTVGALTASVAGAAIGLGRSVGFGVDQLLGFVTVSAGALVGSSIATAQVALAQLSSAANKLKRRAPPPAGCTTQGPGYAIKRA